MEESEGEGSTFLVVLAFSRMQKLLIWGVWSTGNDHVQPKIKADGVYSWNCPVSPGRSHTLGSNANAFPRFQNSIIALESAGRGLPRPHKACCTQGSTLKCDRWRAEVICRAQLCKLMLCRRWWQSDTTWRASRSCLPVTLNPFVRVKTFLSDAERRTIFN